MRGAVVWPMPVDWNGAVGLPLDEEAPRAIIDSLRRFHLAALEVVVANVGAHGQSLRRVWAVASQIAKVRRNRAAMANPTSPSATVRQPPCGRFPWQPVR